MAMAAMLGYQLDDMVGMRYMDLVDPEDAPAQEARKRQREAGSRDQQLLELQMIRRDGRRVLCEVRADAVDYQGEIASTGTLRDVTEERQQQRALVQAERRYRELFQDAPVGLFRSGLKGEVMEVNPAMATMLGFKSPEDLKGKFSNMLDAYADPTRVDLGLLLTAEGIETDEQRQMLLHLGCEFGQGHLFAQALAPEEFERRL